MIKICVWTCNMTSRSYFGKMNSTLGSVVPLAMFRTVTRNAVNKSVWRKKDCSWLPLNKNAMNIWLSSLRIRAHLSLRIGKHLHVLHVLRTFSTCLYPGYQDTTTYAALFLSISGKWVLFKQLALVAAAVILSWTIFRSIKRARPSLRVTCSFLVTNVGRVDLIPQHLALGLLRFDDHGTEVIAEEDRPNPIHQS